MDKLLKQRVEILAQEVDKMKSGGAGEGYTKAEADEKFLSKDDASTDYKTKISDLAEIRSGAAAGLLVKDAAEELVDKGAKNYSKISNLSFIGEGFRAMLEFAQPVPAGSYTISFGYASAAASQLVLTYDDGTPQNLGVISETALSYVEEFEAIKPIKTINLYINSDVLLSNIMLCTLAEWKVSQNYETYALPNPILTPALIEQVDSGAKNLWDFASATVSGGGGADRVTYTKSDDSIAITAVNLWAFVAFDVQLKAGTYYFQGLVSSITGSDSKAVIIRINGYDGTVIKRIEITANGNIEGDFVVDTDRTITISFYAAEDTFTNSSYTISDLMICTEADWKVSQAYQPYRPSYQELYEMVLALQTTRTATTRKTTKTKTNEE